MTAPCLHKQVTHEHGTRLTYALDRCRCLPCSAANSEYEAQRARLKAYGRPTTAWVDAGPARAHVQALRATGMGWKTIAAAAGVHGSAVSRLLYGRTRDTGRDEPPTKRMHRDTAAKLLAVPMPGIGQLPGGVRVDGTGTARRLQALARLGWSVNRLAAEGALDRQALDGALRGRQVLAATATAVAALYDRLWDRRPLPADRFDAGGIARTVNAATRAGWAPPAAWDDDTINDPAATPATTEDVDQVDEHAVELVLDGQPMRLTGRDLEAAVQALAVTGLGYGDIAARVRCDEATVRRVLNTARQRAAREARRYAS